MKGIRIVLFVLSTVFILSSCQKQLGYTVLGATGTLKDNGTGDCLPVTIYGAYQKDTLLISSNSVDVDVNFTQPGNYTIKTDTINGYSFSAVGTAANIGLSTIHMQASGRPILPEVDVFHVKFDTSTCEINIIVTGTGPAANDSIVGNFNGTHIVFKINDTARYNPAEVTGYNVLDISGFRNGSAADTAFVIGVGLPGTGPLVPGTYNVTQFPANFVGAAYQDGVTGDTYFVAPGFTATPAPVFTVTITSVTATKVKGTFSGAIPDAFGVLPDLSTMNGQFSVTIYP